MEGEEIKLTVKEAIISLFTLYKNGPLLLDELYSELNNIGCNENLEIIDEVIKEMLDEYTLYMGKKKRIGLLNQFGLYKGTVSIKPQGYGFFTSSDLDEDIFIPVGNTMDALDGDEVVCRIEEISFNDKHSTGIIIRIVKRNTENVIGVVSKNIFGQLYISTDIPVFLKIIDFKDTVIGDIVKVKLLDNKDGNINGEILDIIGNINTPGMDELAIAYKYGFDEKFSEETDEEVTKLVLEYNKNKDIEIARRKKIKSLDDRRIITIDGEDAKDLDDAISIEVLENGNYRLGVYIADVSYFVKEGSSLNEDALKRATSVYLTNKVLPMLPFKLCNDLCSLNEGEEKLVLALEMEIDKTGLLVDYDITEGVIKSKHRMTYTTVNKILNGEEVDHIYDDIIDDLKIMLELSHILRRGKVERGSLDFDIPEAIIEVDNNGKPIEIKKRERGEGEKIIEDFMIFSNETIASSVYNVELPFVYRVHDEPNSMKMEKFNKILQNTSFKLKTKVKTVTPMMLQRLLNEVNEVDLGISTMLLRLMAKAEYSTNNIGHFGLASKCYTHYTSPIRRYPDLIVHRLVKKYLINSEAFYSNPFDETLEVSKLNELATICSVQERKANDCEFEVEDYKMAEYMEDHIGEEFEGTISSITNFGMFVKLPNLIEGLVAVSNMTDDYYVFDETTMSLEGTSKHHKYKLGYKVKVKCIAASKENKQVDFILSNDKIKSNNSSRKTYKAKKTARKDNYLSTGKGGKKRAKKR